MKTTLNSEETTMGGKLMCVLHANEFQAVNRGYNLSHMNENMYRAYCLIISVY